MMKVQVIHIPGMVKSGRNLTNFSIIFLSVNKNQNKSNNGGAREGAGRKKGSVAIISKAKLLQALPFTVNDYVKKIGQWFNSKDFKEQSFAWEQIFGKAPQSIDHTSKGEQIPLSYDIDERIKDLIKETRAGSSTKAKETTQETKGSN